MDPRIDDVLRLWFGPGPAPTGDVVRRWFTKDPAFDDEIRRRFGALHAEAAAGRLDVWRDTARGALALVIVLDQFSRHLYRDDPRAFATDDRALAITRELRASEKLHELDFHHRMFTLLPHEHAEDSATQIEGVAGFTELVAEARLHHAGTDVIALLESGLDYAKQHAVIIERFGRFPHRNGVLGRASTAEELAFLKLPGSSF